MRFDQIIDKKEELKNIPGIYLIQNIINKKCYIGQSVRLHKRLCDHYWNYVNERYTHLILYKAIKKYSPQNFEVTILNVFDKNEENIKEKLDDLEKKYIEQYNSYGRNGYNQTFGGDYGVFNSR